MEIIKKALRIAGLVVLIMLALCGVGIFTNFNRERYMDKKITTEQTDKKKNKNGMKPYDIRN
jgi:hypothetical protein